MADEDAKDRYYSFALRQEDGTYVIPSHDSGISSCATKEAAKREARIYLQSGGLNPDKDLAWIILDITDLQKTGRVRTFGEGHRAMNKSAPSVKRNS